ncbi:MAG: Imm1 family immunity protein [Streptosporangiaceae bacterium]
MNGTTNVIDVHSCDEFDRALDTIELAAIFESAFLQVNIRLWGLVADDPILIQFLVGHSKRSSLLWHEDGSSWAAAMEEMQPLAERICCHNPAGPTYLEPELTLVTQTLVREAMAVYFMTGSRPESLSWHEMEMD